MKSKRKENHEGETEKLDLDRKIGYSKKVENRIMFFTSHV
jgi:hypothetical protein